MRTILFRQVRDNYADMYLNPGAQHHARFMVRKYEKDYPDVFAGLEEAVEQKVFELKEAQRAAAE